MENGTWTCDFDSLQEMIEYCETQPQAYAYGGRDSRDGDSGFRGTLNWHHAADLATHGWPEGERLAQQYSKLLFDKVASQIEQARYHYDVEGSDFDVARVLSGEPEVWLNETSEVIKAPGRIVKVVFNASVSGGVSTETITQRGALATALVMLLEQSGQSVELIVRDDSSVMRCGVLVKRAGQPLNLGEVAFALCHPSMLRRVAFSVVEHAPDARRRGAGGSYGYVAEAGYNDRGDAYLSGACWYSVASHKPETAVAWLLKQLEAQGVKLA